MNDNLKERQYFWMTSSLQLNLLSADLTIEYLIEPKPKLKTSNSITLTAKLILNND